jgi:hypothetical protein
LNGFSRGVIGCDYAGVDRTVTGVARRADYLLNGGLVVDDLSDSALELVLRGFDVLLETSHLKFLTG